MVGFDLIRELALEEKTKIVMLVLDGLGGLPLTLGGQTELETAKTPNLDRLAREGICGQSIPIARGVTPGSGPAHLALFGYDPLQYQIGRGVLEAVGIGFHLGKHDVAARGNFCTVDEAGLITDRRAGRIPTEQSSKLCGLLQEIELPGVETFVRPVKEHRFVLVLRREDLTDGIEDTDPQQVGLAPLAAVAQRPEAEPTADLINTWLASARGVLSGHHPANMVTLRGVAKTPDLPQMGDVFKLRCGAIAGYPMYRGVARLVGMELLPTGDTIASEVDTLAEHFDSYDFFYLHVKKTDSYGEDGDFDAKVHVIEETDGLIPSVMALNPDVVTVTGDHSTPALLKSHSWHPVPTLIWSTHDRTDTATSFSEKECMRGGLGHFHATELMPLLMADALRFAKFGA